MALVAADPGTVRKGSPALAALVLPDETGQDLLRALRSSRVSGLECLDSQLPGGCLGPGELVVIHGESGCGKSALLRSVLAAYVAGSPPSDGAGHGLPAILVDAEGSFDAGLLAEALRARAARAAAAATAAAQVEGAPVRARKGCVEEAMSRLLVLRPREPADLLRNLERLRSVLAANPRVGLLAVDSMSAWQPLAGSFPRAAAPFLREAWSALARLQRAHSVAVVVTHRSSGLSGPSCGTLPPALRCRHLALTRRPRAGMGGVEDAPASDIFEVSTLGGAPVALAAGPGAPRACTAFSLSRAGEVVSVA